ncbi:MAG: hypothetical protein ACI4I8_06520 [Oscillospiraceae bacterium]
MQENKTVHINPAPKRFFAPVNNPDTCKEKILQSQIRHDPFRVIASDRHLWER